jgi:hypothetical protein
MRVPVDIVMSVGGYDVVWNSVLGNITCIPVVSVLIVVVVSK